MTKQKKKLLNIRPAVIISAGLILGILISYVNSFKNQATSVFLFILTVVALIVLSCYFIANKQKYFAIITLVSLIFFIVGAFLFYFATTCNFKSSGKGSFIGSISEIYSEVYDGNTYTYALILKGNFLQNENANVYAEIVSSTRLFVGNEISFSGNFELIRKSDFTLSTSTFYFASVDERTLVINEVYGIFENLKVLLFNALYINMPNTYGLNFALLTGDTTYVNEAVLIKYREIGIAHLFAVSGLHIGLMYLTVNKLISLLKLDAKASYIVTVCILFLYVWFCGFTSSSLRAFIIIAIKMLADRLGEKSDATTNVSISAIIILLINPTELFNVGFLLSFTVYIGLILFTNPFSKFLSRFANKKLAYIIAPCIIAEVVSTPILLDVFGYASVFSFLFNMLIVPIITIAYPFILLSSILLLIFPTVWAFSIISNLTFTIIEFVLSKANTSLFLITKLKFSYSSVCYYALLYSFSGKLNLSVKTFKILRIILITLTILLFYIINIAILY